MSKEIKGIKVEETESGPKILIDNSFVGPATLKKDRVSAFRSHASR